MITTELAALLLKQATMITGLSTQVIQMLLRLWSPFRDWYDEDLVISRAARSATTVETAQAQSRKRQRAYMKFVYDEMGLTFPEAQAIDAQLENFQIKIRGGVDVYPRLGISPLDVWMRPAEEYRYHVSQNLRENDALIKALERVEIMGDTDLTLARREEIRGIFAATPKITGYRRVIHPELSEDGTSCGLCVVASTRLYRVKELLPIHDRCNCDVLPVTQDQDPGRDMNQEDLQKIYDAAGSNYAGDLIKTKVSFTEHGELGPIIKNTAVKGYEGSRGANGRKLKKEELTPLENMHLQLEILNASLQRLANRKAAGETGLDQSIGWQRDRVSVLSRQVKALERIVG